MDRETLAQEHPELLLADGLDEAFIGIAERIGMEPVAVYDEDKVLEILMRDMSEQDAYDNYDFNIRGAYVGERTPLFLKRGEL